MKHINRDNFRHLTGLGREYAGFVDYVLGSWELDENEPMPAGSLKIHIDEATNEFCGKYVPWDAHLLQERSIGGHTSTPELMLSIIVKRGDVFDVTSLPLIMVIQDASDYSRYHHVYQHHFIQLGEGEPIKNGCYTGMTKRGWRTRWSEHLRAANSGSNYRFHRAIRQWHEMPQIMSHHMIVAISPSEGAAMDIEEALIERDSLYPIGLNMIPGGKAGLAYLRKIGAIGANERVNSDDRQAVINRFFENTARKGLPNPLAAANWLDQNYAERVICSGPDRLNPQQIRDARFLSSLGRDAADIATTVGARNIEQMRRLLSGSTYARIV